MSAKTLTPATRALTRIETEIKSDTIAVYRNLIGQPYVTFPIAGSTGETAAQRPLFDKDFRGWLTHYIWQKEELLLRKREVDQILFALAGASLERAAVQISDPALWELVEREPVLLTLVEFMHANVERRKEALMKNLWEELRRFAAQRGLLRRNGKCFPGGANALSRKLAQYKPVLEQLGIKITMRRSNGCNVTIERQDDGSDESSTASSAANHSGTAHLRQSDDRQQLLSRLQQRHVTEQQHPDNGESI